MQYKSRLFYIVDNFCRDLCYVHYHYNLSQSPDWLFLSSYIPLLQRFLQILISYFD